MHMISAYYYTPVLLLRGGVFLAVPAATPPRGGANQKCPPRNPPTRKVTPPKAKGKRPTSTSSTTPTNIGKRPPPRSALGARNVVKTELIAFEKKKHFPE